MFSPILAKYYGYIIIAIILGRENYCNNYSVTTGRKTTAIYFCTPLKPVEILTYTSAFGIGPVITRMTSSGSSRKAGDRSSQPY
jgi:hypothetical protein